MSTLVNIFIAGAILLAIGIAFVPVIVSVVFESQFNDANVRFTEEIISFTNNTPVGLNNLPLVLTTTEFTVINTTSRVSINTSTGPETGYEILFTDNSTMIFHGVTSGDFTINYTIGTQNATGISASASILVSLVILIFVVALVFLAVKKFIPN